MRYHGRCRNRYWPSGSRSTPSTPTGSRARPGSPGGSTSSCRPVSSRSRRCCPATGHRTDQGVGGEDVRKPRRRRAEQGTGRSGRRRERVAPDRGARPLVTSTATPSDRARVRAGVRPHRYRGNDGRARKRLARQRTSGGRHLSEWNDRVREAQHLGAGRGLGFRKLHSMRQLQFRLPAQRDPLQVLRPVCAGRSTGDVRLRAAGRRRPPERQVLAAGVRRGLHRVRPVRRGLPGRHPRPERHQGDQPRPARAADRRRTGEHRFLRVPADQ